jgi:peptidoglycan/xylan/chitin deacetylase (PgdA/CDA1 family)
VILKHALTLASRGRLSVLIFHRVLDEPDPLLPSEPSAAQFEALLVHIKSRFNVLPLSDGIRRLHDGTLPASAMAITFDDGYADNLAVAAPILRRQGIPATIFIATAYLDGACMFNDLVIEAIRSAKRFELDLASFGLGTHSLASIADRRSAIDRILGEIKYLPAPERFERARSILRAADVAAPAGLMLNRDSVRSLADFGLEVGAHTVTHPILAATSPTDAWREIYESKQDLEELVRRPVRLFAYPNGSPGVDYNGDHVRMVREAGFATAMTTASGAASRASDPLQLPRFTPWTRQPMKFDLLMLRNLRHGSEQKAA